MQDPIKEKGAKLEVRFLLSGENLESKWEGDDLIVELPEFDVQKYAGQAAYGFEIIL